ncbi:MAG: glycoside hydrolase family 13 protein [Actinomycetota bacterium]
MSAEHGLHRPHHDPSARLTSHPRPSLGDRVTVEVELADVDAGGLAVEGGWLRGTRDGEQFWVEGELDGDHLRFEFDITQPVNNYRFHLDTADGPRWLTGVGLIDHDPGDREDFRLITTGGAPAWVPDVVWYQIFPDRFATSGANRPSDPLSPTDTSWARWADWNDPVASGEAAMTQLYGGDLDGVVERLDHLADLGIGGVYLTPVFPARSNHRYDASTFDTVDPVLGGDRALAALSEAAGRRGIRVMTDLTLNHTGDGHEWFAAAQADPDSVEAGFYHFTDHPDRYESWLGIPSLPKLDHRSAELARRYYAGPDSILGRYLAPPFDMAGWRIDVANMTGRLGPLDLNQQVARAARATIDGFGGDHWLVGEHFFDASLDAPGDGWHGVMNYAGITRPIVSWLGEFTSLSAFMAGPGQPGRNGQQMARSMDAVRAAMPWQVTMGSMTLLGSHDTARWRTMCTSDDTALVGFGLLLCLPGAPTFFYGDEIGLTGDSSEQARCPMPWDTDGWDHRFLDHYRRLIAVRNEHEALRRGGFRWVDTAPDAVVFLRETPSQRLLVRASRGPTGPLRIPAGLLRAETLAAVVDADDLTADGGVFTLPGDGPSLGIWELG